VETICAEKSASELTELLLLLLFYHNHHHYHYHHYIVVCLMVLLSELSLININKLLQFL